jgi:hypothetical protein
MVNWVVNSRLAALLFVTAPVGAQVPTQAVSPLTQTGAGTFAGVIVDSLSRKYLPGALLRVEPGGAVAETDSLGRFAIDSLTPATYRVEVFHPLLETVGITVVTQPIRVGPDSITVAILAVPSAATLIRRSCKQIGPFGESAVIGYVRDAESLAPVSGADISIAWIELDIAKETGVRRFPFLMRDTTDANGRFKVCGLANATEATIQARRGDVATAEIPISVGGGDVELLPRNLFLPSTSTKMGRAGVSGSVMLEKESVNAGTRVELVGTGLVAMTDATGGFALRNAPSGTGLLAIRHLGFVARTIPVDLSSREETRVRVTLLKFVSLMDPVLVTARRTAALEKVGFNRRKKTYAGFYITPENLEQMRPNYLSDILQTVPGLQVSYGAHGAIVRSARGVTSGCVSYYMDDLPHVETKPSDVNSFVTARDIVAVEVYHPPETPVEYDRAGATCTTIVLWTRLKIRG